MVSPEVQVGDGDPEDYLWPSPAIRQKAIDLLMERIQAVAVEKIAACAAETIKEINKQTETKIGMLTNIRTEAVAAITRLEAMIDKAERTVVGVSSSPPPPPPVDPPLIADPDFYTLKESVREIARVCWILNNSISSVNNEMVNKGIYINDSDMKAKVMGPLIAERLMKDLPTLQNRLLEATNKLGVYGEY
jgi:hypothetical protein